MKTEKNELNIEHRPQEQRFIGLLGGHEAEVSYSRLDERTLSYDHVFVPDELRGGGIAGKLTRFALEYAREKGLQVRPVCPFVVKYLERHPEYREITLPRA